MTPQKKPDLLIRQRILAHLENLRIPLTSDELDEAIAEAQRSKLTPLEFAEHLLTRPSNGLTERRVARRVQAAKFRDPGTLESFDWKFNGKSLDRAAFEELATGEFVRRRDNVVFVGASGLGKSHLIQGIGRKCCALGYRVRYVTSAELLEDLTAASGDRTLPERVRFYARAELLIIDELGFDKLERKEYPEASSLLYKVIDARTGKASTALVTNIEFEAWAEYWGDPPLAMAMLDRVVDGALIYRFRGKSYRAHRAKPQASAATSAHEPK